MIKNDTFSKAFAPSNATIFSANTYNLIIGLVVLWGFFVNWMMVEYIPYAELASINPWVFLIGYFVSAFFGVYLFSSSDNPIVSFIGYNFVVVPLGAVVVLSLNGVDHSEIRQAMENTGLATAIMMALGTLFPKFFNSIGKGLFIALVASIIAEFIMIFVFQQGLELMNYIVIVIFCGYIGYDWARAQSIPKTLDNAIDSAASIYMDIIILFLRILSASRN